MRCCACDRNLNNFESTRKNKTTGDYLDLCNKCYSTVQQDLSTDIREDLPEDEIPDDEVLFEVESHCPWYEDDEDI